MKFTNEQTTTIRSILSMLHPDKLSGQSAEVIEAATKLTSVINAAKDKGDWLPVRDIYTLIGKYVITKNSNQDKIVNVWADYQELQGQTAGPKAEPKKERKAKSEPKVDEEILRKIREAVEAESMDRATASAYMAYKLKIKGAEAKMYLDLIFVKADKGPRQSAFGDFLNILRNGPMDDSAWEAWLKATTENNRNHSSQFKAIKDCVNAVWAKK